VTTSTQESLWVLRAQCGDHEALECLLRSVQPSLRRFVRGIVGTSHADDVLQDVLIVVCRKLKSLHAPELFRPWAFRIAGRQAFRHIRREKRWPEQPSDESVLDESSAENTSSSTELFEEVLSLENLSPASRAVLVLHFKEDLPLSEVAAILEVPVGTVKSRLAYGLAAIRKQINQKKE